MIHMKKYYPIAYNLKTKDYLAKAGMDYNIWQDLVVEPKDILKIAWISGRYSVEHAKMSIRRFLFSLAPSIDFDNLTYGWLEVDFDTEKFIFNPYNLKPKFY